MSEQKSVQSQTRPHRIAIFLSVLAILISIGSFWESHQARKLSYMSSVPALSATVELLDTIRAAQPLHFKVRLENFGKTSARHMNATLGFKFQRGDIPFEASYSASAQTPHTSDLAPGAHTDLITMNPLNLEHDHDVNFVLSGQYILYLFGKVTYNDVLDNPHEFHFCRYYQPSVPTDPTKLVLCPLYNDAN